MNDLISKSALIDALKVHFDSCFREDGELLYSDHICTSDDVVDLINLVENQPIAYDVDKVVEELYEERTDAIDDFANWLVEQGILGNRCISDGEITDYGKVYAKKYKEQLKAGGNNEID